MLGYSGVYHVWGPPGCGKTTRLQRSVQRICGLPGEMGWPSTKAPVLISSLTRTAAVEIATPKSGLEALPIPRQQIGTLHAHAYRSLGCPEVAEGKVAEWNEREQEHKFDSEK